MTFKRSISAIALVALCAIAGCKSKSDDAALQTDLSLAAQQQQAKMDSISALESYRAANPAPPRVATTPSRSSGTRSSSSTRSSGSSSSGATGTTTTASTGEVTVKNTKRDAAIGAAAGAIIGATTSKNKAKGGIIGGIVGGVLGGVIGNNVDVKKKKPPTE